MLFSGRLLAANAVHALELQAAGTACGVLSTSGAGISRAAALAPLPLASGSRWFARDSGAGDGDRPQELPSPSSSSSSPATTHITTTSTTTSTSTNPSNSNSSSVRTQPSKPTPVAASSAERPASAASAAAGGPTATPLTPPPASPQARSLADTLKQSSPTGRLLDLFAPAGRRGPSGPGSGGSAAAAADAPSSAAAAASSDVVSVVMRAVENCKPLMKIQQNKAGNKVLLVPKPLDPVESTNLAVKWIVQAAARRAEAGRGRVRMAECLAAELLLAYQRKGTARARRDEVHKLALDNRANVRARW